MCTGDTPTAPLPPPEDPWAALKARQVSLERRSALQALWDCADARCALCATCLKHLRDALGFVWPDDAPPDTAPPIGEFDPVRFVPHSSAKPPDAPPKKLRHWRRKTRPK